MPVLTPDEFIQQKSSDKITVVFGRFQPPTLGHKILFDSAVNNANEYGTDVIIVPTVKCEEPIKTISPRKRSIKETNVICSKFRYPLEYKKKLYYIEHLYPETTFKNYNFLDISQHKHLGSLLPLLKFLNDQGYTELYFVSGDDRVKPFEKEINKSNHKLYHYTTIHPIIDVGKNMGRVNVTIFEKEVPLSGTLTRIAAFLGNFSVFYQCINTGAVDEEIAFQLMNDIRKGSGFYTIDERQSIEADKKNFEEIMIFIEKSAEPQIKTTTTASSAKRTRMRGGFFMTYLLQMIHKYD